MEKTLSAYKLQSFIKFLFPNRSRNKWACSTELARRHTETYIRTTRLDNQFRLAKRDFIKALKAEGFLANWYSCSISVADLKILEAANNIVVESPDLLNKLSSDMHFLMFICASIRQHLEKEPRDKQYKVLYSDLELHDAYKYKDELYTIFLLPDKLLVRKERNSILETSN